ncbi:MAG: hypothetical protein IJ040_00920 [Lachnospiraceae bacterium]|nr:hypothetical protein [Lachnospiraceae bacterium]
MDNNFGNNNSGGFQLNTDEVTPSNNTTNNTTNNTINNTSGTYNTNVPPSYMDTPYDNTYSSINEPYVSPFESDFAKKAKTGMILGIVNLTLNLFLCCLPFMFDTLFSPGWIFIALEVWGMKASSTGKQSVEKKSMAKAGYIMNLVALILSILMIVLMIVLTFKKASSF